MSHIMIPKLAKIFFVLVCLQLCLPVRAARADTGPKPTMEFIFQQELPGEQLTITSGILYECQQPDCSDAAPLEEGGPQGFRCEANSCRALAYGFSPYHRLEIEFSDGQTRQSNVFETAGFDSVYTVTVRPDDLLVDAQLSLGIFPRTGMVFVACLCAALGLLLVGGLAIFMIRRSAKN
jgi:hypothetical protein